MLPIHQDYQFARLILMSRENLLRSATFELLANWQITIETGDNNSDEDVQELIMELSSPYIKW
jgi:hypothetical protein